MILPMPVVVADSSPIVYLSRLGRLGLLHDLYSSVLIPTAVWREVAVEGKGLPEAQALTEAVSQAWIQVEHSTVETRIAYPLLGALGVGEREAIALALRIKALLIIDEFDGRVIATQLGVRDTGTLGVLVHAVRRRLIPRLRPEIERLTQETNFRCDDQLIARVLKEVGEVPS